MPHTMAELTFAPKHSMKSVRHIAFTINLQTGNCDGRVRRDRRAQQYYSFSYNTNFLNPVFKEFEFGFALQPSHHVEPLSHQKQNEKKSCFSRNLDATLPYFYRVLISLCRVPLDIPALLLNRPP